MCRKGFEVHEQVEAHEQVEVPAQTLAQAVEVRVEHAPTAPTALATNAKDLAVDVLCRISDIVLHHVYTDEAQTFSNDLMQLAHASELMQALKDLQDAAKALKAASEI